MHNDDKHAPLDIDVDKSFGIPEEEDFDVVIPKRQGYLDRLPDLSCMRPAIIWLALFGVATTMVMNHRWGGYFFVSRDAVFVKGEYWRLFTALLGHSSIEHLISNAPLFVIFGWFLRAFFGRRFFPMMSFVAGILANIATIYFYPPQTRLIGASGMVYGMVSMWLVLYIRFDIQQKYVMRIVRAIAFSLVVMAPTTYNPTTSYMAHGFGFVIGVILAVGFIMLPKRFHRKFETALK